VPPVAATDMDPLPETQGVVPVGVAVILMVTPVHPPVAVSVKLAEPVQPALLLAVTVYDPGARLAN
jgi:hypothetical protein